MAHQLELPTTTGATVRCSYLYISWVTVLIKLRAPTHLPFPIGIPPPMIFCFLMLSAGSILGESHSTCMQLDGCSAAFSSATLLSSRLPKDKVHMQMRLAKTVHVRASTQRAESIQFPHEITNAVPPLFSITHMHNIVAAMASEHWQQPMPQVTCDLHCCISTTS